MNKLVLASGSKIRTQILTSAAVPHRVIRTDVDEDSIKKTCFEKAIPFPQTALELAGAKARAAFDLETIKPDEIVLGVDQLLEFEGRSYNKPRSIDEARERLASLAGKKHSLINGMVLYQNGREIWHNIAQPELTMCQMTEKQIDAYFAQCADDVLSSVGAYQVEKNGIRLFDHIEGDYFAVLGLPLFALLGALRKFDVIDY